MYKLRFISFLLLAPFVTNSFAQEELDLAIINLSTKISQHMTENRKTKIAVVPFQDLSNDMVTIFGKYLGEELTTALFNTGKFQIIERNLLKKVLDELKLSQTGAIDPSSAKALGKIIGVDAVITGTIQDLTNRVAINCRLIETETGNIFAAASEKIKKNETIEKLLRNIPENSAIDDNKKSGIIENSSNKVGLNQKVVTNNFTFELQRCHLIKNWLYIDIMITSNKVEKEIIIGFLDTRMIDDQGIIYHPKRIQIGGKGDFGNDSRETIPKEIPTKSTLTFVISPETKSISFLEIACLFNDRIRTKITFNNILLDDRNK